MKKRLACLFVTFCLVASFQASGCSSPLNETNNNQPPETNTLTFGNLPDNVCGDIGYVACKDGWIYYNYSANGEDALWRERTDGSDAEELLYGVHKRINISDQWIYCVSEYGANIYDTPLVRISLDGATVEPISEASLPTLNDMILVDDWLYYRNNQQIGRIHKDTGTDEIVHTVGGILSQMTISEDGWLYYLASGTLEKMRLDGTDQQTIFTGKECFSFTVAKGYVYCCIYANGRSGLYKIKEDGTELRQLSEQPCNNFKLVEDWLYYYSSDERNIQRIQTDGTNHQVLTDHETAAQFAVVDEWIYYEKTGISFRESHTRKMALDGTNNQPVHS